jgi:hypothetical protein
MVNSPSSEYLNNLLYYRKTEPIVTTMRNGMELSVCLNMRTVQVYYDNEVLLIDGFVAFDLWKSLGELLGVSDTPKKEITKEKREHKSGETEI